MDYTMAVYILYSIKDLSHDVSRNEKGLNFVYTE